MDADTIMKYKIGTVLSAIGMALVTVGQLITTDFIVKGSPILSAVYSGGFLFLFLIVKAFEMNVHKMNVHEFVHWIYVNAEHIRIFHIKSNNWYDLPVGTTVGVVGYAISKSPEFALIAFGVGTLMSYALSTEE